VDGLLQDPAQRAAMGARAREAVRERHDIAAASATLDGVLGPLQVGCWP
jgi:hypothetical protein